TKGFTSPQNEIERMSDEAIETISSLVGPMKFRKALGIGIGSQLAKEGLKISGTSEGVQEAGKLGTMFLLTMFNPKGASKYAASQYQRADQLSRGASVNAQHFQGNLENLVRDLEKGVQTTSKNSVVKPAKELIDKIKGGKILVRDLTAAKKDVNSLIGEPETLKGAKKLLRVLGKEIDQAIKPYEKINPDFAKVYRPANEIFGAVAEGNKAYNFIRNSLGKKSVIGASLAEVALGHPEMVIPTIAGATAVVGSAKTIDFFTRLKKSPELRKYYQKALIAAAKEDAPALRNYADKIEIIMSED
ncbi:MAG TPA: hypothetical protein VK553_07115, partial [Candidatus Nitrosopolaris rasttigaisensis]|nr:hypothetical protein [Candidatus Nitrosopolaris rasttigaisensis]